MTTRATAAPPEPGGQNGRRIAGQRFRERANHIGARQPDVLQHAVIPGAKLPDLAAVANGCRDRRGTADHATDRLHQSVAEGLDRMAEWGRCRVHRGSMPRSG